MKIETKYDLGDSACVMYNNKIAPVTIIGVLPVISKSRGKHIYYQVDIITEKGPVEFEESHVFRTKRELIDSL